MDKDLQNYDVVVFGSGPAGLQAALHAVRSKVKVAVLGRMSKSSLSQAHVENYCCMEGVVSGLDILTAGKRQAEKFGAHFFDQDVIGVSRRADERFAVSLESGQTILTWTLVLAMGVSRNRLNVPGEKEFLGKGVSYCVECDGNFFRDQVVTVVGGESAAASGALSMLLLAREVHLVYRELQVEENLRYQVERSSIVKHPGRWVKTIAGAQEVEAIVLENDESIACSGVFIELGAKGALEIATGLGVTLDPEAMRYISASKRQETNVAGIYAAGDICGPPWQMAKAVGEGCVAGMEAASFAKKVRGKNIP